jgi:hypothetical protein
VAAAGQVSSGAFEALARAGERGPGQGTCIRFHWSPWFGLARFSATGAFPF